MPTLTVRVPAGWTLVAGKKELRATMRQVGAEVVARARSLIRAKATGGKVRASVPGEPPVSRTGTLARSIKSRPFRSGEGVTIRDAAYYALFLEAGSQGGGGNSRGTGATHLARTGSGNRRMNRSKVSKTRVQAPRPFLSRALADVAGQGLAERIVKSLVDGVAFKRTGKP